MKTKSNSKAAALSKTGAAAMAHATRGRARVFENKKLSFKERHKLVADMRRKLGDWDNDPEEES